MSDLDTAPLTLAFGTRIYRALFGDKQAMCWYSTSYPVEGKNPEEPFDLRRAVNPSAPAKLLTFEQERQAESMTLLELRRNCLTALFDRKQAA